MGLLGAFHGRYVHDRRTRVLAARLAALLPRDAEVLDVGCGDGWLDARLLSARPDVSIRGVEVAPRPRSHVPVEVFDGRTLGHPDASFDVVMLVDVLHHAEDPVALLAEAARVARAGILVKDHTRHGLLAGPTLSFMDWVGNARHGVPLPNRYWPRTTWDRTLADLGLEAREWATRLGLYPFPASLFFDRDLHFVAYLVHARAEPGPAAQRSIRNTRATTATRPPP